MHLTRRRLGLGAGLTGLAAALASCSDAGGTPSGATAGTAGTESPGAAASGPWSWPDARGGSVELDAAPQRIVVSQWLLPAFWALGIRPVGVLTFMPWEEIDGYAEAGIEQGDVEVLSTTYGEVDLETLAGIAPDLLVLDAFEGQPTLWGFADESAQEKAAAIAPLLGISGESPAVEGIEERRELAASMGADLEASDAVAAAEAYEAALAAVETVVADEPGLRVAFVGPFDTGLWVAPADDYADLVVLRDLGLEIWKPAKVPGDDILSWENAGQVDADVLLVDDRDDVDAARGANPVFATLPAVEAGQVHASWRFALPYEYGAYARSLEAVAEALRSARPLT